MQGYLKEEVVVDGVTVKKGTALYIDLVQAQTYDIMSPLEDIIVTLEYKFFTVRTIVKKSKIKLAA